MIPVNRNGIFSTRMVRRASKTLVLLSLVATWILLSACSGTPDRFYIPKALPIRSATVLNPAFNVAEYVDIINAQSDDAWISMGTETHEWLANLHRWTDTAAELLKSELNQRGIVATVDAPTVFELILCEYDENSIKGHLFTDVKHSGCPSDTDRDGVPDLLDRCAGTPSGMRVNRMGCPQDTDEDGAPDYRDNCAGKPPEKKQTKSNENHIQEKAQPAPDRAAETNCLGKSNRFSVAGPIPPGNTLQIIKEELEKNQIALTRSSQNLFTFSAPMDLWKATVDFLELALGQRGVQLIEGPPRIFRLSVTRAEVFWTFHDVGCRLNLSVLTNDSRLKNFSVSVLAPELYTSCDEAVSKAVSGMFMKERIIVDTDMDMIPDERDQCPGTPKDVAVDNVGCPLDTDHDAAADRLDR